MASSAPVFNLAGTAVASTTTATIAWPTHATNHVALLLIQTDAEASSLVTAAGFVQVGSTQTTGTAAAVSAVALQVYWKRATTAAEPNVTCADAGDHVFARIITFTNCATTGNPWNVTAGGVKASSSTNCQITGATTTTVNSLIVAITANGTDTATSQASAFTNANLASVTIVADSNVITGNGGGISVGTGTLATPGAIGTTTVTLASAGKNAFMVIALDPPNSGIGAMNIDPTFAGTGTVGIIGSGSMAVAQTMSGRPPTFAETRQAIIDNLVSAQSETNGWNNKRPGLSVTDVVRTSSTVVTITLDALSTYDITARETITVTVPGQSILSGVPLVATPTFTVDPAGISGTGSMAVPTPSVTASGLRGLLGTAALALALSMAGSGQQTESGSGSMAVPPPSYSGTVVQTESGSGTLAVPTPVIAGTGIVGNLGSGSLAIPSPSYTVTSTQTESGSGTLAIAKPTISGTGTSSGSVTGSGSLAVATPVISASSPFAAARAAIIAGLDSAQSESLGWDAIVKVGIPVTSVVRTSDTVVTIALPAFATYDITATETITATVPSTAVALGSAIVGSPTFTVAAFNPSGSLAVRAPTISGSGIVGNIGSGSIAITAPVYAFGDNINLAKPVISGSGIVGNIGSGSLQVAQSIAGAGLRGNLGTGALAVAQSISGTASSGTTVTGTGSVAVAKPSIASSGQQTESGAGGFAVGAPSISGTGQQTQAGTGSLAVSPLSISGAGTNTQQVSGSGSVAISLSASGSASVDSSTRGKYRKEHDSALVDIAGATGFASEHASALKDLEDAGA